MQLQRFGLQCKRASVTTLNDTELMWLWVLSFPLRGCSEAQENEAVAASWRIQLDLTTSAFNAAITIIRMTLKHRNCFTSYSFKLQMALGVARRSLPTAQESCREKTFRKSSFWKDQVLAGREGCSQRIFLKNYNTVIILTRNNPKFPVSHPKGKLLQTRSTALSWIYIST